MAKKQEIFYAVCDLFNEGKTEVSLNNVQQVITATKHTLPDFVVCIGLHDTDKGTIALYVDNFSQVK